MLSTRTRWAYRGWGGPPVGGLSAKHLRHLGAAAVLPVLTMVVATASPAFAEGVPQLSTLASNSGSCTVSLDSPCAPGTADVAAIFTAADPATGDAAIVNTASGYIYLVAGSTGSEFGLSVTAGYTYLLGGDGASTTTYGGPATSSGLKVEAVAFDGAGNLVLTDGIGRSSVGVIARSSTAAYGYASFTAGDLYEVATTGTPASPIVTLPSGLAGNFTGNSLALDASGDIFVGVKSSGILVIDEQAAASVAYGVDLAPQTATFIAGSAAGGTQLTLSNGTTAVASGKFIYKPALAVDGYGNVIFATSSSASEGATADTIWVLPALEGQAVGGSGTSASTAYRRSTLATFTWWPVPRARPQRTWTA